MYVTPRDVRRLAQLVETCVEMGAADAVRAVKELVDDHAFAVGASDRTREEALEDAIAAAEATAGASSGRPKKRKPEGTHTRDAVRGADRTASPRVSLSRDDEDDDDDDEARRARASPTKRRRGGETENPAKAPARASPRPAGALEHLRATRVPGSFQALAEDSTKYGACMAALTRRGGGSKSEEGGLHARRVETRTAEMHELVRRQVVKYDSKLRAALRPETAEPRHPHRDVLDVLDPSADAATGLCEGPSGQTKNARSGPGAPWVGAGPTPAGARRAGGAAAAGRARFGSMPDFPRRRGSGFDERTLRSGGRLEERSARAAGSARRRRGERRRIGAVLFVLCSRARPERRERRRANVVRVE